MIPSSEKLHRNIALTILMAESTHVFCCVLPTVVTVLSLLSGFGVITYIPYFMLEVHTLLHGYEIQFMGFSGGVLALGWVLYGISRRIECAKPCCPPHQTGDCAPRKNRTFYILAIATVIFVANTAVYMTLHRGASFPVSSSPFHAE